MLLAGSNRAPDLENLVRDVVDELNGRELEQFHVRPQKHERTHGIRPPQYESVALLPRCFTLSSQVFADNGGAINGTV